MKQSDTRPDTREMRVVSRRRVVQGAGILGAAAMLAGCTPIAQTVTTPPATPVHNTQQRARVALVRAADRREGLPRLLELVGPLDVRDKRVVIKPNFNSSDPAPGSTHPDVLRGVVQTGQEGGAQRLVVADRSGMGNTRQVMAQLGIDTLANEMGFDLVVLDELGAEAWDILNVSGGHWQQGFPFPKLVREADAVIQLCCLKTHRFGGHFTLSLKNSVGLVAKVVPGESYNYMNELHGSDFQRAMIAEINTAYAPALVIMDGVTAFVSGGPDRGEEVAANVMLAGTDRVALDAVGVALLRHFGTTPQVSAGRVFAQEQLARAVELGLGVPSPDRIDLVSDDAAGEALIAQVRTILEA